MKISLVKAALILLVSFDVLANELKVLGYVENVLIQYDQHGEFVKELRNPPKNPKTSFTEVERDEPTGLVKVKWKGQIYYFDELDLKLNEKKKHNAECQELSSTTNKVTKQALYSMGYSGCSGDKKKKQ